MVCRIFKSTVGWCDVIFLFSENITFKEIKNNIKTSYLIKDDYVGKYVFDNTFLNIINSNKINDKIYYFIYDATNN